MRLGTYSTIDCTTDKIDEAFQFLQKEFEKIGGEVRKIYNPHDFGAYPSFEIDCPYKIKEIKDWLSMNEFEELTNEELGEYDKKEKMADDWQDKANEIESKYNKKFEKYL